MKCTKLGEGVVDALMAGGFLSAVPQPDPNGQYDLPLNWGGAYVSGSWYFQSPNGVLHLRLVEGELMLVTAEAKAEAYRQAEPEMAARRQAHDEEDPKGSYPVG